MESTEILSGVPSNDSRTLEASMTEKDPVDVAGFERKLESKQYVNEFVENHDAHQKNGFPNGPFTFNDSKDSF